MRVETVGIERMENSQRCLGGRCDWPGCGVKAVGRMMLPFISLGRDSPPALPLVAS